MIWVVHESDAFAQVSSIESDTNGVVLISAPHSELNLVSVLIPISFITFYDMRELTELLGFLGIPLRVRLSVTLDIRVKLLREPYKQTRQLLLLL